MNPSQVWLIISVPGTVLALYMCWRGVTRLTRYHKGNGDTPLYYIAWSLVAVDLMCLLLMGLSTWLGILTVDDDRPWVPGAFVAIGSISLVLVFMIMFVVLTEMARREKFPIERL